MTRYQPDLFGKPVYERRAEIPAGSLFTFGGRALAVVKTYGTDDAAPVIVEELTDAVTLKGQLGLWSVAEINRRRKLIADCMAGLERARRRSI